MIDLEFVQKLIQALDESSLDSLELERGGTRIRLSKSPDPAPARNEAAAPAAVANTAATVEGPAVGSGSSRESVGSASEPEPPEAEEKKYIEVTSPMVGTFYRSPAPESAPYVDLGARVGKGSVLCIIEAMKLMNELESDVEGTIAKILVENAEPVEYGQVLFLIDPS